MISSRSSMNIRNLITKSGKQMTPPDAKIFPVIEYRLQFDGCSKSNPGLAGAGAVLYHLNEEIHTMSHFVGENMTNNVAEYTGLIIGLKEALQRNIRMLMVEGDSLLVVNQMNGVYKVKALNLIPLYEEAKKLAEQFDTISFHHIYREKNKRADALSNLALTFKEE